jgi:hypothetical protein
MSKIPQGDWSAIAARYAQGESLSAIARSYGCTAPAIHYALKRNKRQAAQRVEQPAEAAIRPSATLDREGLGPPPPSGEAKPPPSHAVDSAGEPSHGPAHPVGSEPRPLAALHPHVGASDRNGRASAFAGGLDSDLHDRAEAAIETFRSCFAAALAEGSPHERARLRQAAADLMRVAARTTIVLDRLNEPSERASAGFDRRFSNGGRA